MELGVHELGRYAETTKHLDAKVPKVGVASKGGTHYDQEHGVDGRHDHNGADSVGPGTIFHGSLDAEDIFDCWTDQLERKSLDAGDKTLQ